MKKIIKKFKIRRVYEYDNMIGGIELIDVCYATSIKKVIKKYSDRVTFRKIFENKLYDELCRITATEWFDTIPVLIDNIFSKNISIQNGIVMTDYNGNDEVIFKDERSTIEIESPIYYMGIIIEEM